MKKRIIGVYDSEQAAMIAIQSLKAEGYSSEDLSVIANNGNDHYDLIEYKTGAHVDNLAANHDTTVNDDSFLGKLRNLFTNTDEPVDRETEDLEEKLIDIGIPEQEAFSYAPDVKSGKILIAADIDVFGQIRPSE